MQQQTINILVIDDHPFFLEGLKLGLESLEESTSETYALDTLTSPADALKRLTHTRHYDLILCDLHLPELNGIQFIKTLFKQDIWIPIATISASENVYDIECALEAGAFGFINKSLNKDELRMAIKQILGGQQYVPPNYLLFRQHGKMGKDVFMSNAAKHGITHKQFEVLTYMGQGLGNKEISERMDVTINTVKSHTKALFQILNVKNRTSCIIDATKLRLLPESHLMMDENALSSYDEQRTSDVLLSNHIMQK